jgi:hypothetical protein
MESQVTQAVGLIFLLGKYPFFSLQTHFEVNLSHDALGLQSHLPSSDFEVDKESVRQDRLGELAEL